MIVQQTNLFLKQKKKLHSNQIHALDAAVKEILKDPEVGQLKKGNLQSIRVYKFVMIKQECLLAYSVGHNNILLRTMGSHENFYRDLKKTALS